MSVPAAGAAQSVWEQRAPLLEANSEMAVAELNGKIYVLGGYPSSRATVATVQIYDPRSDKWQIGPPLPQPANHPMAAAAGGKLYFIGGQATARGGGGFLGQVVMFDPAAGTWTARAPMPSARSAGVAVVVDGKIYVAGGRPPHGADFAVYDPQADRWTVLPDMPTRRNHLAGAAIGGKIYIVGGRFGAGFRSDMTNVLEVFDPAANSWSTKAPMPTVRGGINGIAANGCLHVLGGEGPGAGPNGVFGQHEVYDARDDRWYSLDAMPHPVHGVTGLAVLDGWIHLPGGGTRQGGGSGSTIHQVVRADMDCR